MCFMHTNKPLNNCHTHCYEKYKILVRGEWIFSFWYMSCSATSKKELIEDDKMVMKVYDDPLIQPTPAGNTEWFWWCPRSSLPAHTSQVATIRMAPQHTKLNAYTRCSKFIMKSVENQCSAGLHSEDHVQEAQHSTVNKNGIDTDHVTLTHV